MRCLHIRCDEPATHLVRPPYGETWPACAAHQGGMARALSIGLPQSLQVTTVTVTSLERLALTSEGRDLYAAAKAQAQARRELAARMLAP